VYASSVQDTIEIGDLWTGRVLTWLLKLAGAPRAS
jgi:hypothetical protein